MFSAELGRPIAFNADDIQAAYRLKKTIEDGLKSLSIKTVAKWWATEYQAIEQNAAASMLALEQALQERRDGELRLRIVELKLQANDRDYRQGSSASLDFIALSSPSSSLPPPPPPFPAPDASPSEVQNHVNRINVLEFPDPSLWNEAWLQRFRDVTPKELAVFHRQVLQKCAVYLPQSEVYGPESAATKALEQVFESYSTFARKVHALAPQAWSERLEVNMDTLEKLPKKPPPEHLLSILIKEASADDVKLMLLAYNAHKNKIAMLKQREKEMLLDFHRLTKSHEALVQRVGGGAGGWETSIDRLDSLAAAMARNSAAQAHELKLLWYVLDHFVPPSRVIKIGLLLYPIPISTLGFHLDTLPLLDAWKQGGGGG